MPRRATPFLTLTAACLGLLANDAVAAETAPVVVQMTEDGPVFATRAGMTLYFHTRDSATPGKSQCTATVYTQGTVLGSPVHAPAAQPRQSCQDLAPPFRADANAVAAGKWSFITRDDGSRQWAYDGRPLYTLIKDRRPGDVQAPFDSLLKLDFLPAFAPVDLPPQVKLVRRKEGLVLATATGQLLYVQSGLQKASVGFDPNGPQPLRAGYLGKKDGDWSIVDAGGGIAQYAFKGRPLFVGSATIAQDPRDEGPGWAPAIYRPTAGTPPQIQTRLSVVGDIYTTDKGMALYAFVCTLTTPDHRSCDKPGDAAIFVSALCGAPEECSRRWRPYRAPADARPVGEWSTVEVAQPLFTDAAGTTYPAGLPRVKTWAYRNAPLFTYVDDQEPGETLGNETKWTFHSGFYVIRVPGQSEIK